jgi:iron complex transport system permease protein
MPNARSMRLRAFALAAALLALLAASLLVGRYPRPGFVDPARLWSDPLAVRLVLGLRLPRVLVALMLGLALGAGGTVFQLLFSNPLVEPGIMGVTQGAAFGAALAIVFLGGADWAVQLLAAVCALGGLLLSLVIARALRYGGWILRLVLAGIAVAALLSSGVGILKYMADPLRQLPDITFWLMGSLSAASWGDVRTIAPVTTAGLAVTLLMRWRLNILALDDRVARSLGAAVTRERLAVLLSVTCAVAAVISVSGVVSWIGLIVPHIARRLFAADARYSLPGSMLLGGVFAVACDDLARTLMPGEIPLGVISSLLGAFFFVIVLSRRWYRRHDS